MVKMCSVGRWTDDEHNQFLEGLRLHGKEWKEIGKMIPTRSIVQIRTHAQKYFQKVQKARLHGFTGEIKMDGKTKFASLSRKEMQRQKLSTNFPLPNPHLNHRIYNSRDPTAAVLMMNGGQYSGDGCGGNMSQPPPPPSSSSSSGGRIPSSSITLMGGTYTQINPLSQSKDNSTTNSSSITSTSGYSNSL